MLNHVRSWLYVGDESRPFVVLNGLPGLYGLKYESGTAPWLPLYLCSYKLDGSVIVLDSDGEGYDHHYRQLTAEVEIGLRWCYDVAVKGLSVVVYIP